MNVSKSEGVWGNKEAIPHISKCDTRVRQRPQTQPDNDGDRGKTEHVSEASPSQSPSAEINCLLLFVNPIISYGSSNRMVQNKCVRGSFCQTYPPPPVPTANARLSSKNIFQKPGVCHA